MKRSSAKFLPFWGDRSRMNSMNLPSDLHRSIRLHDYFRVQLVKLTSFDDILIEIAKHGDTPVFTSNIVNPSAFIFLVFKLHILKITRNQLNSILGNPTSYFSRALGVVYVRLAIPPEMHLRFFERALTKPMEHGSPLDKRIVFQRGDPRISLGDLVISVVSRARYLGFRAPQYRDSDYRGLLQEIRHLLSQSDQRGPRNHRNDRRGPPKIRDRGRGRSRRPAGLSGQKRARPRDLGEDSRRPPSKRQRIERPSQRVRPRSPVSSRFSELPKMNPVLNVTEAILADRDEIVQDEHEKRLAGEKAVPLNPLQQRLAKLLPGRQKKKKKKSLAYL